MLPFQVSDQIFLCAFILHRCQSFYSFSYHLVLIAWSSAFLIISKSKNAILIYFSTFNSNCIPFIYLPLFLSLPLISPLPLHIPIKSSTYLIYFLIPFYFSIFSLYKSPIVNHARVGFIFIPSTGHLLL